MFFHLCLWVQNEPLTHGLGSYISRTEQKQKNNILQIFLHLNVSLSLFLFLFIIVSFGPVFNMYGFSMHEIYTGHL